MQRPVRSSNKLSTSNVVMFSLCSAANAFINRIFQSLTSTGRIYNHICKLLPSESIKNIRFFLNLKKVHQIYNMNAFIWYFSKPFSGIFRFLPQIMFSWENCNFQIQKRKNVAQNKAQRSCRNIWIMCEVAAIDDSLTLCIHYFHSSSAC